MLVALRKGDGRTRTVSSNQTLVEGVVPQVGNGRFSSPSTAKVELAHEGIHPINLVGSPGGSLSILPICAWPRGGLSKPAGKG